MKAQTKILTSSFAGYFGTIGIAMGESFQD